MPNSGLVEVRRALISVSDKEGLEQLGFHLEGLEVEMLSTGGTAKKLRTVCSMEESVVDVSDYTGFPEIMDGRVKTIHPLIAGGVLALRGNEKHEAAMEAHGIKYIDMVVVNLYPFEQVTANPKCVLGDAIENIDIGGPNMIRAAAKNWEYVVVITDPTDYDRVLNQVNDSGGCTTAELRYELAVKAYQRTSVYDAVITNWMKENNPFA